MNDFGETLRKHRTRNNMTQENLAEGICSTQHLYRLETGKRLPSLYITIELSRRLGDELIYDLFDLNNQ